MSTAAEQLRRLLHVLPRVADGRVHEWEELERVAGVSAATLLDDFEELSRRDDLPGGFVEGLQIYLTRANVQLVTPHFHRPMRLTMPELCALELGVTVLRRERPPEDAAVLDRALALLRSAITTTPETDSHAQTRHAELEGGGSPAHLALLRDAVRVRRRLRLRYRGSSAVEAGERDVEPYALVWAERVWYAVGRCLRSESVRYFRVDRMETVEALAPSFVVPATFSLEALLAEGRPFRAEAPPIARVWYSPRVARWLAEREGTPLAADGSLVLEHPVADEAWLARHVLQYGPDAEVLEPAALRASVARRLRAMVGAGA
ncbi:MAG TPA: WYL domain-containing protein [Gemmatimonadaceae bacterium]|nr:WYL domain-containing protein [Gemmatimonadaceae bacterium]